MARARHSMKKMLELLHHNESHVLSPVDRLQACVAFPFLSGPDMINELRVSRKTDQARAVIGDAMTVLGALHSSVNLPGLEIRDYGADRFLPATRDICDRIDSRPKTVVIDGFEVRNFRYDDAVEEWRFFDPHRLRIGAPEEDVARFIISLLMLTWGRGGHLRIWQKFEYADVVSTYREYSEYDLDSHLMKFFLGQVISMRHCHARTAVACWPNITQWLGQLYACSFFKQIKRWVATNVV